MQVLCSPHTRTHACFGSDNQEHAACCMAAMCVGWNKRRDSATHEQNRHDSRYMGHGTWYMVQGKQRPGRSGKYTGAKPLSLVWVDYGMTSKIIHRSSHVTAHMKWLSNVCGETASMIVFASGMVRKQRTAWRDVISGMPIATATAVQKKTTADPSSERVYRLLEHRARTLYLCFPLWQV